MTPTATALLEIPSAVSAGPSIAFEFSNSAANLTQPAPLTLPYTPAAGMQYIVIGVYADPSDRNYRDR